MWSNVYKKIELVGTSSQSFSDAASNAIQKASQTLHSLEWFEVTEHRGKIENGKIAQYQVTVKVGFKLD